MTYSQEHRRLRPVLRLAESLDISTNLDPAAIFEPGNSGFQIWCTPENNPGPEWGNVKMTKGCFSKPCEYVASVIWGWEGERITHLCLTTDAYALEKGNRNIRNRAADVAWAMEQTTWLFQEAGVVMPEIRVI